MADTVKKSRIVSESDEENDKNLEETLLEEFNMRLKHCMSKDDLKQDSENQDLHHDTETDIYETLSQTPNTKIIPHNGISAVSQDFINNEIAENYYEVPKIIIKNGAHNGHDHLDSEEENIYENIPEKTENMDQEMPPKDLNLDVSPTNTEEPHSQNVQNIEEYEDLNAGGDNSYETISTENQCYDMLPLDEVRPKPTFPLPTTCFTDFSEIKSPDVEAKSVKDRMFLASDDTSTLLFTQTVTSPMLTPSDENIDFLKGFQRENTNSESTTTSNSSPPKEEITRKNSDEIEEKQDTSDVSADISVSDNIDEERVLENGHESKNLYQNVEFLKNNVDNLVEQVEENIYENIDELRKETVEPIYQNYPECLERVLENDLDEKESIEEFLRNEKLVAEHADELTNVAVDEDVTDNVKEVQEETMSEPDDFLVNNSTNLVLDEIEKYAKSSTKITEERINGYSKKEVIQDSLETEYEKESALSESYKTFVCAKTESHSNYYEKYTEVLTKNSKNGISNREKDTETVPAEIVKNLKSQFLNKSENKPDIVGITKKENRTELKLINITKHINKFEHKELGDGDNVDDSNSEYSETIVETNAPGERVIKKKKTKKTRTSEKENISVNGLDFVEGENFYNVNVKSLCRSFGDLTKLGEEKNYKFNIKKQTDSRGRTKSMSDVLLEPKNKFIENVFSGVSVRSLKSSFSKFDALQKKNVLHVRSSDSSKAQEKFNGAQIDPHNCKKCGKQVFQMEQIKAERAVWHKNCFRCSECSKQLAVDAYESNEGSLYCKPHFKALFAPKAVEEESPQRPRKPELIIRENQPLELPPDVVRASDKPDLGLEELQSLNVKERFQVFEHHQTEISETDRGPTPVNVKRSPSILSKLARFQKHGMDVGVSNEALDGIPVEESSTEEEEEEELIEGDDAELVRAKKVQKEKPFHFTGMSDVKKRWEMGDQSKEERREETKQEIQSIRNRLFMGKQEKMKEAYQQAIMESESSTNVRKNISEKIEVCDTKSIKERFEKGEVANEKHSKDKNEEEEVYKSGKEKSIPAFEKISMINKDSKHNETTTSRTNIPLRISWCGSQCTSNAEAGKEEISKNSRSLFLELDAGASKPPQVTPVTPPKLEVKKAREAYLNKSGSEDTIKSTEYVEDVEVKTADIQQRFKFFETYKEPEKERKQFRITPPRDPSQVKTETPDREIYRDPDVIRSEEYVEDSTIAKETHTATKMLNKFRQMEEDQYREPEAGLKPLKRFTPPLEPARNESNSEEEEESEEEYEEEDEEEVDHSRLPEDLIEAQKAARAKQLRAKFEKWEQNEIKREQQNSVNIVDEGEEQSQIESTRVLRARFESMRESSSETSKSPRVKVNRFV